MAAANQVLEAKNPNRSPWKRPCECGVCGFQYPRPRLRLQRGLLVCERCYDNPHVFNGVLTRPVGYGGW